MNYFENGVEYSEFLVKGKKFKRKLVRTNVTHGMSNTRIYNIYKGMKRRCNNPNAPKYNHYGGKGIKICDEWLSEDGFLNFYNWSMDNGYSNDLTIDRINANQNYEPYNCRWITLEENIKRAVTKKHIPKYRYTAIHIENNLCVKFYKIKDFEKRFNVDERRVSDCLNNKLNSYEGWEFTRQLFKTTKGQETIPKGSTEENEFPLEVRNIL